MSFMKKYKQQLAKSSDVSVELKAPQYFLHTGSYSLNKLMSGRFEGGSPQGRLVCFAGHSSSGKSLVAASVVAEVVRQGGFALVVDTEEALDEAYMKRCGVDTDSENYLRVGVSTIPKCSKIVNDFIKDYRESGETQRAIICVDSLDNLLTDSEQNNVDTKGEVGGDQGQRAKQIKAMLKPWTHSISSLPITIICTKQVYEEQDKMKALSEPWVVTASTEYAFSQIIIFEKLIFKDTNSKEHKGFTLKARSYKNRMAKEKQVVKVEVPFDKGLEPYAGILEIAEQYGVVSKAGAWYTFNEEKFQRKKAEADPEFMHKILEAVIAVDDEQREVYANLDDYVAASEAGESAAQKRKRIALERAEANDDSDEE